MAFTTIKAKSKNIHHIDFNRQQIVQVYLLETLSLLIRQGTRDRDKPGEFCQWLALGEI